MSKKLFLLDAMALIYRAYYAMIRTPRITSKGLNTSAILGFANTLVEVLKKEKPTHIAVSFDTGAPTLRHADFADYKANREATPDDIITAIPYIKSMLEAFNIPIISLDGYEADDVIGTVAKHAEIAGFEVYMMTSDKDYGQLVSEHIKMYKPAKFGKPAEVVGPQEICEKYGITKPEQLIDILGLWGDSADNIPGVPNVGEVKARKLIQQFGTIENIYAKIEEVDNEKLRQSLLENQEKALMSKMLATIILDVPIQYDFDQMKWERINVEKLKRLFAELEFRALGQRIFNDPDFTNGTTSKGNATANGEPDLFSNPDESVPAAEDLELFQNYNSVEHRHHPIEIENLQTLLSSGELFFMEWIWQNGKVIGIAFAELESDVFYCFAEEKKLKDAVSHIIMQNSVIVSYNCKQTFKLFKRWGIVAQSGFFDPQIAHYLIQPEQPHELDKLSENYLNYSLIEFPKGATPTQEILQKAACEKIEVLRPLYALFHEELVKTHTYSLFEGIEMELCKVLAEMEYDGVRVDANILHQNSEQLAAEIVQLEEEIYRLAGTSFNIASPKQLGEILFDKLCIIENAKLTKTKQYQTGEEILTKLINKHPIVPLILEYRTLTKLKSTYIDALPALINPQTGRIHTTFTQTVTSTGRLSSVNPNLQNIPIRTPRGRDIRKAFVAADAGSVILAADYSQIELRIVAAVCGDENMIAAFNEGKDIHAATASQIYKTDIEHITSDQRRIAKTVNFGILYGMSAFGLADRLHIGNKEATELISEYFHSFPKINEYLQKTTQFAKENGYVETLFGRRRYIRDINSGNALIRKAAERNAINAPIQGTAADLIKIAMVNIFKALKERNLKTKMVLQVHDELVFEVPKDELAEVQVLVMELMENAMKMSVPLKVEANAGTSWFEAH